MLLALKLCEVVIINASSILHYSNDWTAVDGQRYIRCSNLCFIYIEPRAELDFFVRVFS